MKDLLNKKEITALLHLLDDPDEAVYEQVSERLLSYGKPIINNLEAYWEEVKSDEAQERIEQLIHHLQFEDLRASFYEWKRAPKDILTAAILVSRFNYPELDEEQIHKQIEKIRRNIWLELNNYLTPMEQINVTNSILFNYCKHRGAELDYQHPEAFLLQNILETKKGNAIGNGILYLILAEMLDIPLRALDIPQQFILGYQDLQHAALNPKGHNSEKLKFYVDGLTGQMYSHKDIENYFKRVNVPPTTNFFRCKTNTETILYLLEQYSMCFDNDRQQYKKKELEELISILKK